MLYSAEQGKTLASPFWTPWGASSDKIGKKGLLRALTIMNPPRMPVFVKPVLGVSTNKVYF